MSLFKISFRLGLSALASFVALPPLPMSRVLVRMAVGKSMQVRGTLELVANDTPNVVVFLFDGADQPVSAEGWSGNAILLVDGAAQRFDLTPDANGQLRDAAAVPKDVKGALQLVAPDGTTAQAKY